MLKTEQETIILFNEAEQTANVFTYNIRLKNKLKKLSEDYPDQVTLEEDQGACVSYNLPKRWIRINSPPKSRPLTEEEREKRAERMKALRRASQNQF